MEKGLKLISETQAKLDYNVVLADLLVEGGYEASSDICEEFFGPHLSPDLSLEISFALFTLTEKSRIEPLLVYFQKIGYRPANLYELLVWGNNNKKTEYAFSIVALDSMLKETGCDCGVPALTIVGNRRNLEVLWFNCAWQGDYGFLAVKL